jgi:hypothetical protein
VSGRLYALPCNVLSNLYSHFEVPGHMPNTRALCRRFLKAFLPVPVVLGLLKWEHAWQGRDPLVLVRRMGALWRTRPIRPEFGWKYGQCIDRYYIEKFLEGYSDEIQGRVLELLKTLIPTALEEPESPTRIYCTLNPERPMSRSWRI